MQKTMNKKVILFSIISILLCLSSVSAEDLNDKNITGSHEDTGSIEYTVDSDVTSMEDNIEDNVLCSTYSSKNTDFTIKENKGKFKDSEKNLLLSELNDSENYTYYIDSNNLYNYFNNGVLKDEFKDSVLVFNGEFVNKGIITINSPNMQIIGNNALFKNTGFCLDSNNILISDFNFIFDQEFYDNDYASILVLNNNNTIYNCNMNYTVPIDCSGFCVYCEGSNDAKINGFNLINNNFNFVANNLNEGWDYPVFLDYVDNAVIYGNYINALLPLRDVDWSNEIYGGARMDKVGAFVADTCENLTLLSNYINSQVNSKIETDEFPTLDTVLIYNCNNSLIENNYIYSEDFYTSEGTANYLYGLDLYTSDNVTIIGNQIHIRTTGGTTITGTAYPIQVTGPSTHIKIAYNNISSVNNGPNIGIYSHNFYGATEIHIISNFINITGRANTDNWALVSGIEVQDSNDLIWNNTIIVTNLGDYGDKNNIYGISYSQNTNYNHTYNIQYNTVITNGNYAVLLSGDYSLVTDSIIANNVLNTNINSGNDAVYIGKGTNNNIFDNSGDEFINTLNTNDLPDWLKNHKTITVAQPTIIPPKPNSNNEIPKPPIINPEHTNENSNGSGTTNNSGNGTMPWNKTGNNSGLNMNDTGNNKANTIDNKNTNNTEQENDPKNQNTGQLSNLEQVRDLNKLLNSNTEQQNITTLKQKDNPHKENTEIKQESTRDNRFSESIGLKVSGKSSTSKSHSGSSDSGSSAANNKIYEVKEKTKNIIKDNPFPSIIISALVLLLIFVGYKHKSKEE